LGTSVFGENLVDGGAVEVALFEGVVAVKDEGNIFTIIDISFGADSSVSSTVGVNAFEDTVIESTK
jgi:hypothetical protein